MPMYALLPFVAYGIALRLYFVPVVFSVFHSHIFIKLNISTYIADCCIAMVTELIVL